MRHPSPALEWFTNPDCYVSAILLVIAGCVTFSAIGLMGQQATSSIASFPLDSVAGLEVFNGKAEVASYRGRRGVHLIALPGRSDPEDNESVHAFVAGVDFRDGTIEADVAGALMPGAPADARGFIGIDFRSQEHGARTESIYLRPTNGRADDQLRRNHSVQYDSLPDFPWFRLRKESPGVYESYTDLEAGAWTHMKIVVSGTKAALYVNGSNQPCLIVSDLKLGETHGQVGFWGEWSTDAYFSKLTIRSDR
ncbi:MAG: hypothetical protein WBE44_22890 [Terriglobales bacterium]|jgi:hypothetical protein